MQDTTFSYFAFFLFFLKIVFSHIIHSDSSFSSFQSSKFLQTSLLPQIHSPFFSLHKRESCKETSTKHHKAKYSKTSQKPSHGNWTRQTYRRNRIPKAGRESEIHMLPSEAEALVQTDLCYFVFLFFSQVTIQFYIFRFLVTSLCHCCLSRFEDEKNQFNKCASPRALQSSWLVLRPGSERAHL